MTQIKIGADELILWLRKNGKAIGKSNEVLGEDIRKLIEGDKIKGKKLEKEPCYWANEDDDKNIGQMNLPKCATQYWIDTDKLPELYNKLNNW